MNPSAVHEVVRETNPDWGSFAARARGADLRTRLKSDAAALSLLWTTHAKWNRRSIERVELVEDRVLRSLSVDVELPWRFFESEAVERRSSVPMPLLVSDRAAELIGMEVRDGADRRLPLRSLEETTVLGIAALALLIDATDSRPAHEFLDLWLPSILDADQTPGSISLAEKSDLGDDALRLLSALKQRELLLVDVPRGAAARELFTATWEEPLVQRRRSLRIAPALAATVQVGASLSPNRHVAIDVPRGLELEGSVSSSRTIRMTLRPTRRAALQLLTPMLAIVGLSIALLVTSSVSGARSALAALLLLGPGLFAAQQIRSGPLASWSGWGVDGIVIAVSVFFAAAAVALEASGTAIDVFVSLAGLAAATTGFAAAVLVAPREERSGGETFRHAHLDAFYEPMPPVAGESTDRDVTQAVEDLIASLSNDPVDAIAEPDLAVSLTAGESYVETARPSEPELTGDLIHDVLTLAHIEPDVLAEQLGIPAGSIADRVDDEELSIDDRRKLAAARAAALTLYGGLDAQEVGRWLTDGEVPPLEEIARGEVDRLRERLDRYLTSPAG